MIRIFARKYFSSVFIFGVVAFTLSNSHAMLCSEVTKTGIKNPLRPEADALWASTYGRSQVNYNNLVIMRLIARNVEKDIKTPIPAQPKNNEGIFKAVFFKFEEQQDGSKSLIAESSQFEKPKTVLSDLNSKAQLIVTQDGLYIYYAQKTLPHSNFMSILSVNVVGKTKDIFTKTVGEAYLDANDASMIQVVGNTAFTIFNSQMFAYRLINGKIEKNYLYYFDGHRNPRFIISKVDEDGTIHFQLMSWIYAKQGPTYNTSIETIRQTSSYSMSVRP